MERSWFSGYYNNVVREDDSASELVGSWKMDYFTHQVSVFEIQIFGLFGSEN